MGCSVYSVTIDCSDPAALARFWALALDYVEQPPPDGFATWEEFAVTINIPEERWKDFGAVVDPDGVGPRLFFQRVPEGKTAKNRMHLDIDTADVDGEVLRLEALGARRLDEARIEHGTRWVVMADPEGNEFCVCDGGAGSG